MLNFSIWVDIQQTLEYNAKDGKEESSQTDIRDDSFSQTLVNNEVTGNFVPKSINQVFNSKQLVVDDPGPETGNLVKDG